LKVEIESNIIVIALRRNKKGLKAMNELSRVLSDKDLNLLVEVLMPGCRDMERMTRVLRDDEDILEGMLTDERLFNYLMNDPESLVSISPYLFFSILLNRVKNDLKQQPYTIERQDRYQMVVFDSRDVVELLRDRKIFNYLIDMLVSFVRINSYSVSIRVRKGIWRKYRFSDFDIDSLIKYSEMIDEEQRFPSYKRIADICLFIIGVFSDYVDTWSKQSGFEHPRLRNLSRRNRDDFMKNGQYFYRAASEQKMAQMLELNRVLQELSEKFILASKPLTFLSRHYLGLLKEKLFLQ
jgi:hypothetical protein